MTGPGVRGLVLFTVDGPTGDDAPCLAPEELRAVLADAGHRLFPRTVRCVPWCPKCAEPLDIFGDSKNRVRPP